MQERIIEIVIVLILLTVAVRRPALASDLAQLIAAMLMIMDRRA